MKVIADIFRALLLLLLAAVVVVSGSLTAVFFVSRDNPEDIFLLDYALVYQKGEDEKLDVWLVKDAAEEDLLTGDGVIYFKESFGYKAANTNFDMFGATYYDAENLESRIFIAPENLVGKVVAVWQQK